MLWYKSWLETRWRFVIGLVLLTGSACLVVLAYPRFLQLLPLVSDADTGGEIGRRIRAAADVMRTYRGYAWSQWFNQNLSNTWTIFAVLLGTGGIVQQTSGRGALFTLALPVSRVRLTLVRAATGFAELFVLAVVPSLLIPVLSPAVGQHYGLLDTLVQSGCLFIGGSLFFAATFLLSTVFTDVWKPPLIMLLAQGLISLVEQLQEGGSLGIFHVMSAERYFRGDGVPWVGLLAAALGSSALVYAAVANVERRDF